MPTLTAAVPILPARDVEATARFYRDRLGFQIVHAEREYGIVARDGVEVHFWGPSGTCSASGSSTFVKTTEVADSGVTAITRTCSSGFRETS